MSEEHEIGLLLDKNARRLGMPYQAMASHVSHKYYMGKADKYDKEIAITLAYKMLDLVPKGRKRKELEEAIKKHINEPPLHENPCEVQP